MSIKPGKAERDQWIVRLYNSGKNAREIAAIVGISYELARYTLVHHKNELTETPRQRYDRKYKGKDDTIRALKAQGLRVCQVMRLTGASKETVQRVFGTLTRNKDATPDQLQTVLRLAEQDASLADVQAATGLTATTIRRIERRYGFYLSEPEDLEQWEPPIGSPVYADSLQLKPMDRARYEKIHRHKLDTLEPKKTYGKYFYYGD